MSRKNEAINRKECTGVVVSEGPCGEFVEQVNCRFGVNGDRSCALAQLSTDRNHAHVRRRFCLQGNPDSIPDVRSN